MNTENHDTGLSGKNLIFSLPDRWIISRLQRVEKQVINAIANYRLDLAAQAIYEFTWNEYCDWYLELSKPILSSKNSTDAEFRGTRSTLVRVLETLLRLSHPIIPYITEEIWQRVAPLADVQGKTIMLQPYPEADEGKIDAKAETDIQWVMDFVMGVRKIRSGMNIDPKKPLPVLLQDGSKEDHRLMQDNEMFVSTLAKTESTTWLKNTETAPESATALVGKMKILIPMAGLIDKEAELARLNKEIEKLGKERQRSETKLANPKFVDKAPTDVVEKERNRLADMKVKIDSLNEQVQRIEAI